MRHLGTLCLLTFAACSNSGVHGILPGVDGGGGDGFGSFDLAAADGSGLIGDLMSDPGGPTITVTAPTAGSEVQYDTLMVTATIVSPDGTAIDPSTVKLIVPAGSGTASAPLSLTSMPTVYSGQIDISAIVSGGSNFQVAAQDTMGRRGIVLVAYIHDHGPVVTIVQPSQPTAHGSAPLQLVIDDPLHPITDVRAGIRSASDIALTPVAGSMPLRETGTITFSGYTPPLDGPQLITAQATNSRGTIGRATRQFIVDNQGPIIVINTPQPGVFVGGILAISTTITDISGVAESSVFAVFGHNPLTSTQLRRSGTTDNFLGVFDVRSLGRGYVTPSFSVRAADTLGNQSELAVEIIVDNTPPGLELDSTRMRVSKRTQFGIECSRSFDPLGDETANDGDRVPQIVTIKARIEDAGNWAPGLLVERVSGINASTVAMFASPTSNGPLAVDTDGDGICDDVNPLLIPTTTVTASNQALSLAMTAIPTGGGADYRLGPLPAWASFACSFEGEASVLNPPNPLCVFAGTTMTISLSYTAAGTPAIWTIPPVTSDSVGCIGLQLDSRNRLPEGPTCIVARASDNTGNHNVARPLRVCIDRGGAGVCAAWPPAAGAFPDCTGTYNPITGMVSSAACRPGDLTAHGPLGVCSGVVVGGYCYRYFNTPTTWSQADVNCANWAASEAPLAGVGGHLASVMTMPRYPYAGSSENEMISALGAGDKWIGFGPTTFATPPFWSDGESVDSGGNWAFGEPASTTGCALMNAGTGTWRSVACTSTAAYVCKRPFSTMFGAPGIRFMQ